MGQARIISGGTNGQYSIEPVYLLKNAEMILDTLKSEKTALEIEIQSFISEISYQEELLGNMVAAVVDDANSGLDTDSAMTAIAGKRKLIGSLVLSLAKSKVKLRSNEKQIDKYNILVNPPSGLAWCTDFSEELMGTVETIELGREKPSIIAPSGSGGSGGLLQPVKTMTPAQAFLNYSMLPRANKWQAHYAEAIISNVDEDYDHCTVTLIATTSTHQNLPAILEQTAHRVPIKYMWCNATAFEDGSTVLVVLAGDEDQTIIEVIGYLTNPVICPVEIYGPAKLLVGSIYYALGGKAAYVWDIAAVEPGSSSIPTWIGVTNPETGEDDGSAIEITDVIGCCGGGIVSVTATVGGDDELRVRFPLGAWRMTHYEGIFVGNILITENVTCCSQSVMDARLGTVLEGLCDWDKAEPCYSPAEDDWKEAVSQCCAGLEEASGVNQIAWADGGCSASPPYTPFSDGDIAYYEYIFTIPVNAVPDAPDCPPGIGGLPYPEHDDVANACLIASSWACSPKNAIEFDLPAGETMDDYSYGPESYDDDHKPKAFGRFFYEWQCDEYTGNTDIDYFVFKGCPHD